MSSVWIAPTRGGVREHLVVTDQTHPVNRSMRSMCGTRVKVTRERDDFDIPGVNTRLCLECQTELDDLDETIRQALWEEHLIEGGQ